MIKVVWSIEGEVEETVSHVKNASDFLNTLDLVDEISLDTEIYKVIKTEMVVDNEPYIFVLLRYAEES